MRSRRLGRSLILARKELDPEEKIVDDDCVKVTREPARHDAVGAKDWRRRYHHRGTDGALEAVLKHLRTSLLHCLQVTPCSKQAKGRERTSC
jgi:hypothetical protein